MRTLRPAPPICIDVLLSGTLCDGWATVWAPRVELDGKPALAFDHDRTLERAIMRYRRWEESIRLQTPRAKEFGVCGVRLEVGGVVVCAFCREPDRVTAERTQGGKAWSNKGPA